MKGNLTWTQVNFPPELRNSLLRVGGLVLFQSIRQHIDLKDELNVLCAASGGKWMCGNKKMY